MKSEIEKLKEEIFHLKLRQTSELSSLQINLYSCVESLKPISIIKGAFEDFATPLKSDSGMMDKATGLLSGFLSKKLMIGNSHNPIKIILGTVLQIAITNLVTKNVGNVKIIGETIFELFSKIRNRNKR